MAVPLDGGLLSHLRSLAPLRPGEGFLLVQGDRIAGSAAGTRRRAALLKCGIDASWRSVLPCRAGDSCQRPELDRLAALALPPRSMGRSLTRPSWYLSLVATLATLSSCSRACSRPLRAASARSPARRRMRGTDELTQLANRRTFTTAGTHELARARRSQRPPAVAVIDVDDFKWVNDTFRRRRRR